LTEGYYEGDWQRIASGGAKLWGGAGQVILAVVGTRSAVQKTWKVPRGGLNGRKLWGRADTLDDHFHRHGADFGARNAGDYAQQASDFLRRSQADGLPTKIGPDGTIRVYDPASNTFGSFNPDGTTKTFFKPSGGQSYWDGQPGGAPWTPR
ncbi:MAG: hypothetical protein AAF657_41950, partial [Acidobacteriota bacterium]